jgi:hypothetical protein
MKVRKILMFVAFLSAAIASFAFKGKTKHLTVRVQLLTAPVCDYAVTYDETCAIINGGTQCTAYSDIEGIYRPAFANITEDCVYPLRRY